MIIQKYIEVYGILQTQTSGKYNNGVITAFNVANVTDLFNFKEKMKDQRDENGTKYVEIIVPLKRISNFWRTLEMAVINYKINFFLTSSTNYVIVFTTALQIRREHS